MSGHKKWSGVPRTQLPVLKQMVSHVQGYILAMEDILRDIENQQYGAENADSNYLEGYVDALTWCLRKSTESLDSAKRTLEIFTGVTEDE